MNDVVFALRLLRKSPGFTLAVVLLLGAGIGATTAMFGLVDALFLRPLPFHDEERIVMVQETQPTVDHAMSLSNLDFHAYAERSRALEAFAAFHGGFGALEASGASEPITFMRVSPTYFRVFDGKLELGRLFEDNDREGDALAVISDALFRRVFHGDPSAVGSVVTLAGRPVHVIGVLEPGYADGTFCDLWTVDDFPASLKPGNHGTGGAARVKQGVSIDAARADLDAIAKALAIEQPETNLTVRPKVTPFHAWYVAGSEHVAALLSGAALLVLLVACANVAGLLLSRASARGPEIALRFALGATRARVVRQLLVESAVLALAGGALGLGLASWGIVALLRGFAPNNAYAEHAGVDARAFLFAALVSLVTTLAFGVAPALVATSRAPADALRGSARATEGPRAAHGRRALIVGEVAIALVLVAGAGVLLESLHHLTTQELGYDPRGVSVFRTKLPDERYPDDEARAAAAARVLDELAAAPGTAKSAIMSALPSFEGATGGFEIEGRTPFPRGAEPTISFQSASPGYASVLGVRVVAGRFFEPSDARGARPVVVVNELFARRFFGSDSPLGHRVRCDFGDEGKMSKELYEIVGVFRDTKNRGLVEATMPELLFSFAQRPDSWPTLAVRGDGDVGAEVEHAVRAVDPRLAVSGIRWARGQTVTSYAELVDKLVTGSRFYAGLLALFSAIALALAAAGVYGLVAFEVAQRKKELAIRLALGATPALLVRSVLARQATLVGAGVVIGLVLSAFGAKLLASLVYGMSPLDPLALSVAALVIAASSLVAALVPALRVARASPMMALRRD